MKAFAAVAAALGACLITVGFWLRRRWLAQERIRIVAAIVPLGPQHYRFTGEDEAVRIGREKRREAANSYRSRARKVESGESVSSILRVVKR